MNEAGKHKPSHARLYTLIGLMVILWSFNFIVAKIALREFPPLLLSCLRTSLAGLMMFPIYLWKLRTRKDAWDLKDVPVLVYLGVFGVALNQIFFVAGMSRTSVGHSALMISMTPVMVLVIAAIVGQEHVTWRKVLGMGVAIAGIALLNFSPAKSAGASFLGDGLILLASLTFALFTVVGKGVTKRHDAITVNTFAYLGGALLLAPFTWYFGHGFPYGNVSLTAWSCLVYMSGFSSVLCYLIFYYALTHIPASRVSAFSYLQPILATLMAVAVLHEPITSALAMGGAFVMAGVYLTERG